MGNSDKRGAPRLPVRLEVELELEGEQASLHTRDLSNNGAFLEANDQQLPPVGSIIYLRLKQGLEGGEAPMVKAKVVRNDPDGFALKFLEE